MQSLGRAHSFVDESTTNSKNSKSHSNDGSNDYSYDNSIVSHDPLGDIGSSNGFGSTTPFFADVTLDISIAHDIAETPEAVTRKTYDADDNDPVASSLAEVPTMPSLPELHQRDLTAREAPPSLYQRADEPPRAQTQTRAPLYTTANKFNSVGNSNHPQEPEQQQKIPPRNNILQNESCDDPNAIDDNQGFDDDDSHYDSDNHVMARVTSNHTPGGRFRPFGNTNGNWRTRLQRKKWPKDISWAVAFWMFVPIGLLVPLLRYGGSGSGGGTDSSSPATTTNASWLATATPPRSATLHTLFWGLVVAVVVLPRLLYRTSGGVGAGDDARHFATQFLLVSAPLSACVYLALVGATYWMLPSAFWPYGLIPTWCLARDLYLFRRWKMTSTTPGGRQAFFQALACASLDILSRSLKRKALYRILVIVITGQFGVVALWRLSLLAALRSGSFVWATIAFVGGKWATGTIARLLTLMACGGVSNWFAEQSALLEGMKQAKGRQEKTLQSQSRNRSSAEIGAPNDTTETIEFATLSPKSKKSRRSRSATGPRVQTEDSMPEAYRIADASEYKSAVNPGMDGDYESDDEDFNDEDDSGDEENYARFLSDDSTRWRRRRDQHRRREIREARSSTVRQLLKSGLTVSFGSVTKCGLLGGPAQFVWSQIRKIDHARATFGGMRGTPVGSTMEGGSSSNRGRRGITSVHQFTKWINTKARHFVRNHSDLAMSYVADYQMSYTRAAREVAMLVDEAGVEPIIHDDISTHISACVGGCVSGIIILFTGAVVVHQRNRNDPGVPDSAVALDMVIAFLFCYTLIFTAMEPLRASIKAVYVCFAQHPEALSNAFPLIFHRLSRMSQSNLR